MKKNLFQTEKDIPVAIKLLDYLESKEFSFETAFNILNGLAWLIVEHGYSVIFYPENEPVKKYNYPVLVGAGHDQGYRESYKKSYTYHLLDKFKEHLSNKEKMILLDYKGEQIKSYFAHP